MSHTPGPWTVLWPKFDSVIVDAVERVIASVSFTDHVDVECEANSYLMAAAPDLLAALKAIAANSDEENEWDAVEKLHANLAVADAAIAKAEGR